MKICHAFIFFSIKFAGGTSDLMYKICKAQEKEGLQPVVYSGNYKFDSELASSLSGVEFAVEKSFFDKEGLSIMPGLIRRARKELRNFDVVHMHVLRTFQNLVLYYYCRKYGIPYIIDAHGAVPYHHRKKRIKRIFDYLFGYKMLRNACLIIAETNVGVAEYKCIDPTLEDSQIVVLSPPFATEEFESLPPRGNFRAEFGISSHENVIMFLGRVHFIKGNDFLIKGFAEFVKRRKDSTLVIVGPDDGHMYECKKLAKKLGISEKVIFTGFLFGEKKLSALIDADIVAQMSRQEQGAWAPLEGVLCGTPIIVTSNTGAGEDVRRLNAGYLVDFDDVQGLSEKIEYILTHRDEALKKTLKAKAFIENNLSMRVRVKEYTHLYELCANKKMKFTLP